MAGHGGIDQEGDKQKEARKPRQQLPTPIHGRTKGRLLIEVDPAVGLAIRSTRVPYDESIGDFVARNRSTMDALTRIKNDDTLTSQYIRIHRDTAVHWHTAV